MLTANGKAMLKINGVATRPAPMTFHFTNDTVASKASSYVGNLFGSSRLYVGTGTSTPSSIDYALTNPDAGLTMVTKTGTNDSTQASYLQDYIAIYSTTYRNDTASDITVSEAGIIGSTAGAGATTDFVLIARETFTPVTIAPNESYTFTMYIG